MRKNSQVPGRGVITAAASSSQNPWLQSSEAQQSGFMNFSETKEEAQDPSSAPAPPLRPPTPVATLTNALMATSFVDLQDTQPVQAQDVLDMQLGIWVELVADNRWVRAQLFWISPHGILFMITSQSSVQDSGTVTLVWTKKTF